MNHKATIFAVILSLTLSGAAFAVGPTDVRSKMAEGSITEACLLAEQLGTADGFALAAECLLSEIMLGEVKKRKKQSKQARELAEIALEADPTHQNARLQYAIADGFITRETGDVSAWMKKLPQKTEAIVEAYRTDFPTDPRGDALLGAWNLAIARRAGNDNAQKWFGASVAQGQELFRQAYRLDPDDIIINVNYAFSLLALDEEDLEDVDEARDILMAVTATQPVDHIGRVLKAYAAGALTQIEDRDRVGKYAGMFLDGKIPVLSDQN